MAAPSSFVTYIFCNMLFAAELAGFDVAGVHDM